MLTPQESKVVLSTLTKRRAWLLKTLEDSNIDMDVKAGHTQTLKLLESGMKKLAASVTQNKAPVAPAEPIQPKKPLTIQTAHVLVAEDSGSSAELLVSMLEDIGVKSIDVAKDGREAFDKIKKSTAPYNIILCDWDMPELSGLEVYKKARDSNTLKGAYFCMVTAVSEAAKIREAIQQGVNDYIVKPVDGNILEGKVKTIIENQQEAANQ